MMIRGLSCEIENEPNYNQGIVDNIYGASSAFEPSYTQPDLMQLGLFPPQTPEDNTCLLPDMPDMPIINELPQFNDKIIDSPRGLNQTISPFIDNMPIIEEMPQDLNPMLEINNHLNIDGGFDIAANLPNETAYDFSDPLSSSIGTFMIPETPKDNSMRGNINDLNIMDPALKESLALMPDGIEFITENSVIPNDLPNLNLPLTGFDPNGTCDINETQDISGTDMLIQDMLNDNLNDFSGARFMTENGPGFDVSKIGPNSIIQPILDPNGTCDINEAPNITDSHFMTENNPGLDDLDNFNQNNINQPIIDLKPGDKIFNLDAGEYRTVLENGSLSDINRIPSMYFPDTGQKLINNQDDLNDALQNPGDYFRVETIR